MAKEKPTMNVVFVGHVDAGKSTCVGRLMFDGGAVSGNEFFGHTIFAKWME